MTMPHTAVMVCASPIKGISCATESAYLCGGNQMKDEARAEPERVWVMACKREKKRKQ